MHRVARPLTPHADRRPASPIAAVRPDTAGTAERARGFPRALALALLALGGCATVEQAPVEDHSRTELVRPARPTAQPEHVVEKGDTLYGIAFRHGLDVAQLAAWNGLRAPFTIYPGQRLRLAARPAAGPERAPRVGAATRPLRDADAVASTEPLREPDAPRPIAPLPTPEPTRTPDRRAPPTAHAAPSPTSASTRAIPASASPSATTPSATTPSATTPSATTPSATTPSATTPSATAPSAAAPLRNDPPRLSNAIGATATTAASSTPSAPPPAAEPAAPPMLQPPAIVAGTQRVSGGVGWRWPAQGTLLNRFVAGDPGRQGIDIRGTPGQTVLAAADGEVVYSGNGLIGYGELIIIKHANDFLSAYGHNRKRLVAEGGRVVAGQPIAEMGRSGSGIDLLHFEIRRRGKPVDPLLHLPGR
jgi:lipoprotein NlpD